MNKTSSPPSFSQFGEDRLIWKYFGEKNDGFFVEVGANEPENLSQTFLLERKGWRGILVEPQSTCCEKLRHIRPQAQVFQVACGAPDQRGKARFQIHENNALSKLSRNLPASPEAKYEEVQIVTLDDILNQAQNPRIDFLSIDVEGLELQVLQGFNLAKHQPKLLLIEDNISERLKVHRFLKMNGYRLVKRTGCNNWYVPQGQPFKLSTAWEQIMLFRKMYLGTAFRKLQIILTGRKN